MWGMHIWMWGWWDMGRNECRWPFIFCETISLAVFSTTFSSDLLQLQKGVSIWTQSVPKPLPTSLLAISLPPCAFTGYKKF